MYLCGSERFGNPHNLAGSCNAKALHIQSTRLTLAIWQMSHSRQNSSVSGAPAPSLHFMITSQTQTWTGWFSVDWETSDLAIPGRWSTVTSFLPVSRGEVRRKTLPRRNYLSTRQRVTFWMCPSPPHSFVEVQSEQSQISMQVEEISPSRPTAPSLEKAQLLSQLSNLANFDGQRTELSHWDPQLKHFSTPFRLVPRITNFLSFPNAAPTVWNQSERSHREIHLLPSPQSNRNLWLSCILTLFLCSNIHFRSLSSISYLFFHRI
jgi:hypothetical protein